MAAIPSGNYTFEIGTISFQVERQNTEMYPGIEAEMIVIEYEIDESEAGVCPAME